MLGLKPARRAAAPQTAASAARAPPHRDPRSTVAERIAPGAARPSPAQPRGRFTQVEAQRAPLEALESPDGRATLETLLTQHGHRPALLRALAQGYAGRRGDPPRPSWTRCSQPRATRGRRGQRARAHPRRRLEHRGALGRVAWTLGLRGPELGALVSASGSTPRWTGCASTSAARPSPRRAGRLGWTSSDGEVPRTSAWSATSRTVSAATWCAAARRRSGRRRRARHPRPEARGVRDARHPRARAARITLTQRHAHLRIRMQPVPPDLGRSAEGGRARSGDLPALRRPAHSLPSAQPHQLRAEGWRVVRGPVLLEQAESEGGESKPAAKSDGSGTPPSTPGGGSSGSSSGSGSSGSAPVNSAPKVAAAKA
jgi:hypothetical protein